MRKPAFCTCENKGADQLGSLCAADQHLCFCYIDSAIFLLPKFIQNFKPLAICGCTARFVWDLVENPEDRFCCDAAHVSMMWLQSKMYQLFPVVYQMVMLNLCFKTCNLHSLEMSLVM